MRGLQLVILIRINIPAEMTPLKIIGVDHICNSILVRVISGHQKPAIAVMKPEFLRNAVAVLITAPFCVLTPARPHRVETRSFIAPAQVALGTGQGGTWLLGCGKQQRFRGGQQRQGAHKPTGLPPARRPGWLGTGRGGSCGRKVVKLERLWSNTQGRTENLG